jgi:hypothetical protein|tara:strand:+ start:3077 stop:3604 length:528 start_codon:yes stop_codon:yes gene_type:complete
MIQTFDTQLEVSLRALRELVAPALKNADGHVVEQFNLALVTLEFARQRLPYARSFHRLELQHLMAWSSEVQALVGEDHPILATQLSEAKVAGANELTRPEAEIEDYLLVGRKLRELIGESIQLSSGKLYEKKLDKLVLLKQKEFLSAQRTWCLPLGLDSKPDELKTMAELVESAS